MLVVFKVIWGLLIVTQCCVIRCLKGYSGSESPRGEHREHRGKKGDSGDIKIILRSDTSQLFFEKSLNISYLDVF